MRLDDPAYADAGFGVLQETPAGAARAMMDSLRSPETADLRWYSFDASSYIDTKLTLFVSTASETATYFSYSGPGNPCGPVFEVDGAVLHFETADGTFNESISGVVSDGRFNAFPSADFAGSYDTAALKERFATPELWLTTSFSPAGYVADGWGELLVRQVLGPDAATTVPPLAIWTITSTTSIFGGTGGAAGIDASAGSDGRSGTDASAGSGGSSGTDASPE